MKHHPGTILLREFLVAQLAIDTKLPEENVNALVDGKLSITEEIAEKLSTRFGTSKEFWLNLQKNYDSS